MSTDTAVCKHNAGPAQLALDSGEAEVATATVTGNTVTGAVACGRRRHHEGGGTAELYYQWARAAPRVTSEPHARCATHTHRIARGSRREGPPHAGTGLWSRLETENRVDRRERHTRTQGRTF